VRQLKRYYETDRERILSNCSISGFMCQDGERVSGEEIITSIAVMHDRGNGLGGGFAAYGIYPEKADFYALHLMYDDVADHEATEAILGEQFDVDDRERIPTRRHPRISDPPLFWRYFVTPKPELVAEYVQEGGTEDDFMVDAVMHINKTVPGAFVVSSGKNMGAFKGVGFPEDIGRFFRLEDYRAYTWTAHGRFPTNTPGWWGGAHPFTLLDTTVVHNGEISSYGINMRYVESFGYTCTMRTDTEVVAYLFDLLLRKHGLPLEIACKVLAPPFWSEIEHMAPADRELATALREVYAPGELNGPFAVIFGTQELMVGLNDRVKLRPLIAATKGCRLYLSSEECGIREIEPAPDRTWMPTAGEPTVGRLLPGAYDAAIGKKGATARLKGAANGLRTSGAKEAIPA
jgi:glutamate synthase domain-containing protein 1